MTKQEKLKKEIKGFQNEANKKKLQFNSEVVAEAQEKMTEILQRYECGLIDSREYLHETAHVATDSKMKLYNVDHREVDFKS